MASKEARDTSDHPGRVDALAFELLHDVEEVVVDLRLVAEFELDLVQVREGVFNLEPLEVGIVGVVGVGASIGVGRSLRQRRRRCRMRSIDVAHLRFEETVQVD